MDMKKNNEIAGKLNIFYENEKVKLQGNGSNYTENGGIERIVIAAVITCHFIR